MEDEQLVWMFINCCKVSLGQMREHDLANKAATSKATGIK